MKSKKIWSIRRSELSVEMLTELKEKTSEAVVKEWAEMQRH